MKNIFLYFITAILFFTQTSCVSNRRLTYFKGLSDTTFTLANTNFEPTIQKGDIIYIGVTSANPIEAAIFNSNNSILSMGAGVTQIPSNVTPGQLITDDGIIKIPQVGQLTAIGKTTKQLANEIQVAISPFLKDPLVTIRFLNFRVTVLGEVLKPSVINVTNERISILEAIGQAGDLTPYGIRENVLLIRDSLGTQQVHRFSLLDKSIFSKPYYFLKPNDIIYVEANNIKGLNTGFLPTILPLTLSTISLLVIIKNSFK